MKEYICQYCGKSTYDVDIDYLVGYDHLSCDLERHNKAFPNKKKQLEISNWNKLTGNKFDVMGASFFISDTSHAINVYTAWVHPLDSSEALVRVTLFTNDMHLQIKVLPPKDYDSSMTPIELTTTMTKVHLSNPSIFVQTIAEGLLDDPSVRDIIQFVGRRQDENRRKKGTYRYVPTTGLSGSSGNNLW